QEENADCDDSLKHGNSAPQRRSNSTRSSMIDVNRPCDRKYWVGRCHRCRNPLWERRSSPLDSALARRLILPCDLHGGATERRSLISTDLCLLLPRYVQGSQDCCSCRTGCVFRRIRSKRRNPSPCA